jgi:hypothetical protein
VTSKLVSGESHTSSSSAAHLAQFDKPNLQAPHVLDLTANYASLGLAIPPYRYLPADMKLYSGQIFAGALDRLHLPLLQLSFKADKKGISMVNYRFTVELGSIELGSLTLEQTTLTMTKPAGGKDISVYGSALLGIGDVDATCSFSLDRSTDFMQELVLSSDDDALTMASTTTMNIAVSFPRTRPSIAMIIGSIIGAVGHVNIWSNVPKELFWVFDSVEFETVTLAMKKTGKTWSLSEIFLRVNINNLTGNFDVFGKAFAFNQPPSFQIAVTDPWDSKSRMVLAQLSSVISIGNTAMRLTLNMSVVSC